MARTASELQNRKDEAGLQEGVKAYWNREEEVIAWFHVYTYIYLPQKKKSESFY